VNQRERARPIPRVQNPKSAEPSAAAKRAARARIRPGAPAHQCTAPSAPGRGPPWPGSTSPTPFPRRAPAKRAARDGSSVIATRMDTRRENATERDRSLKSSPATPST